MLQVESMTFSEFTINCLLGPDYLVDELVAKSSKQLNSEAVLGVDDPDAEESAFLKAFPRDLHNLLISQSIVSNCHAASRVCRRELPWRISSDHVKSLTRVFHLSFCQSGKFIPDDVNR